ncbi:MAG: dienelactone hydrolase family protein [Candidatus Omnitrophica bacterium]|nr:dienelactone hydrolase family protein [Candidatus Omnitrophota bacterium]
MTSSVPQKSTVCFPRTLRSLPVSLKAFLLAAALGLSLSSSAAAEVQSLAVEYQDGPDVLEGYLAYDDAFQGERPAVIVIHEWKGLGDYAKRRADMLARMGYLAFAADMYGRGQRAADHAEAAKLAGLYLGDRNKMRSRAKAALDYVRDHPLSADSRIAAIGYCFGGTAALEMARAGMKLSGAVSFHGALNTPLPAGKAQAVPAKVLVFHGSQDAFIPQEDIAAFQKEMTEAGADWQFVAFSQAVHSFTVREAGDDPSTGMAYNREADERSWNMLKLFLQEIFSFPR